MARPGPTLVQPPPAPPPVTQRAIVRVKYLDHGPGPSGSRTKPSRELHHGEGKLEFDALGVIVHGEFLVPWANICWVQFTPE